MVPKWLVVYVIIFTFLETVGLPCNINMAASYLTDQPGALRLFTLKVGQTGNACKQRFATSH